MNEEFERPRRQLRGVREIEQALEGQGELPHLVICVESPCVEVARVVGSMQDRGIPVRTASAREMRRLCAGPEPAEIVAFVGPAAKVDLASVLSRRGALWLLTGTAYPGNAGFVIRNAEVSGADGVVIDAAFSRTERRDSMRYAMRADRYLPVFFADAAQIVQAAHGCGRRIIAIEDVGREAPWDVDLTGAVLFVVGSEETGIPEAILESADQVVRIPTAGFLPSYNLQAAMAVVLGERLRQQARNQ